MSPAAPADLTPASSATSKKRKPQRKRPKKPIDAAATITNMDEEGSSQSPSTACQNKTGGDEPDTPGHPVTDDTDVNTPEPPPPKVTSETSHANGHAQSPPGNGHPVTAESPTASNKNITITDDTSAKLRTMGEEREALRAEVEQLRRQLETIQETHASEVTKLKTSLEESEAAKDSADERYQTLLGRVEKIKETLGERLKRDRAELEEANIRIEELEAQNDDLQKAASSHGANVADLKNELLEANRELASLRSRNHLSQENWFKEKDDMARQVQRFRSELESTSSAMAEWEAIAMEERQMRESVADKASELEEQLVSLKEAYDSTAEERDSSLQTIDGLQRALQEIQDARRKELRDLVESSEEQLQEMKKQVEDADQRVAAAEAAKESLSKELERTAPFEKEVKEKNLLIGKLRHEGIILNDHLTKALRYLKKTKPDEQVDRQIISNYLVQFLSMDRSDPKRFQILQVIAGYLAWTDEQKEQAGLARPGASQSTLRLPASPFHRTPSTPSLSTDFFSDAPSASGKESLADLWAGFLERSAEEGRTSEVMGLDSRKGSVSSMGTSATMAKPDGKG